MKKLIIALLMTTTVASTLHAKPGGWIKDFFQGSSITYSSGYCHQPRRVYYERPVYYSQPAVIYYEQPHYYQQPRYVPMQPYQSFQWQGGQYHNNRCR
jgi:hypothetical protein